MAACVVALLVALRVLPTPPASAVLLLILAAGFLIQGRKRYGDLLHPIPVFGSLWCGCLALASLRLLPMFSDWSWRTWLYLLIPLLTFPAGVWIAEKRSPTKARQSPLALFHGFSPRRALIAALLSLLVGGATLGHEYSLIGGIPVLSDNPDALRMELFGVAGQGDPQFDRLGIKLLHPFVEFAKYAVFLAWLVLLHPCRKTRATKALAVLLALAGTLAYASQGGRTQWVCVAVVALALVHYLRRPLRLRELGVALVAGFLFVALYGAYRIQQSQSAPLFDRALAGSSLPAGPLGTSLAFGYSTLTISFQVFNGLVEDLPTLQLPAHGYLFYSLHRLLPRSNIQELALNLYSGESITPTFLGEFYADYGILGVALGPLALGIFYGFVYARGQRQGALYSTYTRAVLLQSLVFFPYVDLFSQQLTWMFDFFFMYWLLRFACRTTPHAVPAVPDSALKVPAWAPPHLAS
jgi:oligosaccharide repeat unit polymerase